MCEKCRTPFVEGCTCPCNPEHEITGARTTLLIRKLRCRDCRHSLLTEREEQASEPQ